MERSLTSTLEAILYLKGQPVPLAVLADEAGCGRDAARKSLRVLMATYADRDGALEVVKTPEGYCLQLKAVFGPLVEQLVPADVGVGALRTLAVVALQGPISLSELVEIRGSGAYQQVQELVDRGLASKRPQPQGRSSWIQVTERFYRYFQVARSDDEGAQQLRLLLDRYRTELDRDRDADPDEVIEPDDAIAPDAIAPS